MDEVDEAEDVVLLDVKEEAEPVAIPKKGRSLQNATTAVKLGIMQGIVLTRRSSKEKKSRILTTTKEMGSNPKRKRNQGKAVIHPVCFYGVQDSPTVRGRSVA
ncbi:unnamed protein product [Orchesella dallaii]|uniref:Uncharacterized protein n=1 Tax=Orchesella dallaii TaxID=48710 RepID=A0ABP1RJM5_9HEXA